MCSTVYTLLSREIIQLQLHVYHNLKSMITRSVVIKNCHFSVSGGLYSYGSTVLKQMINFGKWLQRQKKGIF